MGIDKKDIEAIIHFNLPKTLEGYIQEIGRAGRNGKKALCHLFLEDEDYFRLRGFVIAEGSGTAEVSKVVEKVMKGGRREEESKNKEEGDEDKSEEDKEEDENENEKQEDEEIREKEEENENAKGLEQEEQVFMDNEMINLKRKKESKKKLVKRINDGINYYILENDLVKETEMKSGQIMTILLKMEDCQPLAFEAFPITKISVSLKFYKTSIQELSKKYELLKNILEHSKTKNGCYSFNLVNLSNLIKKKPKLLINEIRCLSNVEQFAVELSNPAFCYRIKDNKGMKKEDFVDYVLRKNKEIEKEMLFKIDTVYLTFKLNSFFSVAQMQKNENLDDLQASTNIQEIIQKYFEFEGN